MARGIIVIVRETKDQYIDLFIIFEPNADSKQRSGGSQEKNLNST